MTAFPALLATVLGALAYLLAGLRPNSERERRAGELGRLAFVVGLAFLLYVLTAAPHAAHGAAMGAGGPW